MSRLSARDEELHRIDVAYYRWEFLRRNEDYSRDYSALIKCCGPLLEKSEYPKPGYHSQLPNVVRRRLAGLHVQWCVGFVQDPAWSCPLHQLQRDKALRKRNPFWGPNAGRLASAIRVLGPDTVRFTAPAIDFMDRHTWCVVAINRNERPSQMAREVFQHLERLEPSGDRPRKFNVKDLDLYLKAWDMKRAGHTMRTMIPRLLRRPGTSEAWERYSHRADVQFGVSSDARNVPNEKGTERRSHESNKRQVARLLQQARKLIEGGYRSLS